MFTFLEIARQRGDAWLERTLIKSEDLCQRIQGHPEDSWYRSTLHIHSEQDLTKQEITTQDLSKLFETSLTSASHFVMDLDGPMDQVRKDLAAITAFLESKSVGNVKQSVFFSGCKGVHLELPINLSPSIGTHHQLRSMALQILSATSIRTLDLLVYNARRMWRLEGTKHQKTGKIKQRINHETFIETGEIVGLASPESQVPDARLSQLLKDGTVHDRNGSTLDLVSSTNKLQREFLDHPLDCIAQALAQGVPEGSRNNAVYHISLYFKDCGLSMADTLQKINQSAITTSPAENETTVKSAFNHKEHRFGLRDSVLKDFITDQDKERFKIVDAEYESWADVAARFIHSLDKPTDIALEYGVEALDKRLGGLIGGELVVLGGSTGTGKSEFGFHVARHNATRGCPSAFITLELSNDDFIKRTLRSSSGIAPEKFWSGSYTQEERDKLREIATKERDINIPLFFRKRKKMMNPDELHRIVSRLVEQEGVKLVVIDHLHYLSGRETFEKESNHIASCIREINTICTSYRIAVICVAHFRKLPDPKHRPSMHEFRDSSAIEQEASTILLLWRDMNGLLGSQYGTEFTLAKSRKDLPLQIIKTRFDPNTRQYVEVHDK